MIIRYLLLFFLLSSVGYSQSLRQKIDGYLRTEKAVVGLGMYHFGNEDSLTVNNNLPFPMQSAYKFHLAMAVLAEADKGRWNIDDSVFVSKADLLPDTWSPLRDDYPEGNVRLPLRKIIEYTVGISDNSGCDYLFKMMGGPKSVHRYFRKSGIKNLNIKTNETTMQANWDTQFINNSTPWATIQVLQKFYAGKVLSQKSYDFLWQTMVATVTGPKRIKGLLPSGTVVGHKTGTSGQRGGIFAAINDVGVILLPNGQAIAVVFWVSKDTEDNSQRIIAEISKMIFDNYSDRR